MQNTLNLNSEACEELDVLSDVERAFGISIENHEAESAHTVGQLYDLIQAKCGSAERTQACFSQVAFYRLRRAIGTLDSNIVVTPDTPVSILRHGGGSIARKWKELGTRAGLRLPPLETPFRTRRLFGYVSLGALAGAMAGVWARHLGLGAATSFCAAAFGGPILGVAALSALHLVFRDIPRRITTVGDLAREAAGCSFAELRQGRPAPSAADRWDALTAILRQISGHRLPISRDTTFFPR